MNEQDAESTTETDALEKALASCQRGQEVELALGTDSSLNSFLIDPIAIPAGISLIVDGDFPALVGCKALLTFDCDSGVYGYGVLDGQGDEAEARHRTSADQSG